MATKLTKNFTLEECIRSDKAIQLGIENTPTVTEAINLTKLCIYLAQPVRDLWGGALKVNSGFRNEKVNTAVGGVKTSHHRRGMAIDVTTGSVANNLKLIEMIRKSNLKWTQLINEHKGSWVHLAYDEDDLRQQYLTIG